MQMGHVVPSLAYRLGGVKNYAARLDNPRLRAQNLAKLPAQGGPATVTHTASPAKEAPMSYAASNPESSRQARSRRRFLQGSAALGAALVAWAGRPLTGRAQPAPDDP